MQTNFAPAVNQSALRSHSYDSEWALDKRYVATLNVNQTGYNFLKSFDDFNDALLFLNSNVMEDARGSHAFVDYKIWDNKEDRWLV